MNKKILVAVITICLLLVGLMGIFWQKNQGKSDVSAVLSDYSVKETSEGKVVVNDKEKLSMVIPSEWQEEKSASDKNSISFYSADALKQQALGPIQNGCKLTTTIADESGDLDSMETEIRNIANEIFTIKSLDIKRIQVSRTEAIMSFLDTVEVGFSVTVQLPKNGKTYSFIMYPGLNRETCISDFDDFLKTVSID